jgi:xylulokinase
VAGHITAAASRLTGLPAGTPVFTGAGDVPASQLGAGATSIGDAHLSLGTAVYVGITIAAGLEDPMRQLGPLAHVVSGEEILWLEIATGGAALSWLTRQLGAFGGAGGSDHSTIDRLVDDAAGEMDGLLFAPWLTGERVPLFDDAARAAFVGLSIHHGPGHLIRAVMEGVACQIAWAFDYGLAYGVRPGAIRAVGGGSIGSTWTRIIADHLGRDLDIVADPQDAAARGAAACVLVGLGLADGLATAVPVGISRTVRADEDATGASRERLQRMARLHEALLPFGADPSSPGAAAADPVPAAVRG